LYIGRSKVIPLGPSETALRAFDTRNILEPVRAFLCLTVSTVAACASFGQTAGASPHFEVADIHPSPTGINQVARGPFMNGVRYDLRNATIVDLIAKAYDVTADKVLEGPSWLEYDRFDISALMPPKTSSADAKLMLQALLVDRFNLAFHKDERPLSAYALTAPKGKQKLKESDGSGDTGCRVTLDQPRPADIVAGAPPTLAASYTCKNMTMEAFAQQMTGMLLAQQFIGTNPVQDKTGIEGKWDFNFKYTLPLVGPGDGATLPDALDKQLGLKLEQATLSLPVIVVEKANRASPNEPDVAKKIPASPAEFEVATVKPLAPADGNGFVAMGIRMQPGGRVEISGLPLKMLVQQAWGIQADTIVDAPKWMETDRYSIVAKMPSTGAAPVPNTPVDTDSVYLMLRALLADRFKLAAHFEDRPMSAYTLTASKPKLKKADPATRTKWTDSSGPIFINGANGSAPSRTIKFQNMSMAQLAEKLQFLAGPYVHAPVIDATGIEGGYDFTLTFSLIPPAQLAKMLASRPPDAAGAANGAADPIGGVSIFEAVEKQLGLKLVEQKRPVSVLVIDHIEQQPTEN
jgi:uncharacterized protein (TIGR03435 family)